MNEKTKKIVKYVSIGLVALGGVGLYLGGGTEGYAIEIIASLFAVIGIVTALINK